MEAKDLISFAEFAKLKKISKNYAYILELKKDIDTIVISGRKFIIKNERFLKFKKQK